MSSGSIHYAIPHVASSLCGFVAAKVNWFHIHGYILVLIERCRKGNQTDSRLGIVFNVKNVLLMATGIACLMVMFSELFFPLGCTGIAKMYQIVRLICLEMGKKTATLINYKTLSMNYNFILWCG